MRGDGTTKLADMTHIPSPANPPERLLCGPGPCNVSPAALAAMQKPLLGHMDPDFADILLEVVALQRIAYQADGGLVLPLRRPAPRAWSAASPTCSSQATR